MGLNRERYVYTSFGTVVSLLNDPSCTVRNCDSKGAAVNVCNCLCWGG
jgi:hypothetical protein